MKNFFKVLIKVIKAYSLEEKVISVLLFLFFAFFAVKGGLSFVTPGTVLADTGVYTEGVVNAKPLVLNPLYTDYSKANRDVSYLIFSGLLKYDPKVKGFVEDLANMKISEDKRDYVFTLKEGVKWHDGEPVTADDIMFTFGLVQSPDFQNAVLAANFAGVKIAKVDDRTVKFSIDMPNSFFVTSFNVGLLPKHLLEGTSVKDLMSSPFNLKPVGTGPYKIAGQMEMTGDGRQRVVLALNENYYGVKPSIKEIRFNIYPDEDLLLKDKGLIDIVDKLSGQLFSLVGDSRFGVYTYSLPQYTAVFFNAQSPILTSDKMRVGLIKSIDKDVLISKLSNKARVDTPLMNLNQKDWMNKTDLKVANGAFFDAGYKFKKDDKDQVLPGEIYRRDKDGKELELSLLAMDFVDDALLSSDTKLTVEYLVDSWKQVGVKVVPKFLAADEFYAAVKARDYDMVLTGQSMVYNLDTFTFWHSSQAKEDGLNLSNLKSLAVDQQIEKIRTTFDDAEKVERQKKLAEDLSKEAPALFLYRPVYSFLTDGRVKGINLDNLAFESDRFAHIEEWCASKDCKNLTP